MTIEERIERLERTNRRYRLMFTLLGVIAVCAVGISATQDEGVPDVIQAKAFDVVDNEGNSLVRLKDLGGGGGVAIMNKTGELLVVMGLSTADGKDAGAVMTFREGKMITWVGADSIGNGAVTTHSANGQTLVSLNATASGDGTVTTFNDQGKNLVSLGGMQKNDGGYLVVHNKTGETVCSLAVDEYGNGVIGAWDRNGKGRTLKPGP